jgi:mono/diheme cytochrome c family protein
MEKERDMKADRMVAALIGILVVLNASGTPRAKEPAQPAQTKPAVVQEKMNRGPEEAKVTIEEAIQTALATVRGRVHELEVVHKGGKLVWEVEVITPEGRHFLVEVDGTTGVAMQKEEKTIEKLAGDATKGKVIFEKHCLSCHGADGKGTGPMGTLLTPPAANYTSDSSRLKSDAELLHTIQEGRTGTAMRSFKRWLTKQEMRDVLAYVRVLSRGEMP